MDKGVIYVLTNPSFPEYVKIGYADNIEKRLSQLNKGECLPFAFRAYCVYEVEDRLKDKDVHYLIDKLNPELRAVETFDGKSRVREFYNITAEDAYEILYSIAAISGTVDRLKKIAPEGHEIIDEQVATEIQDFDAVTYTEEDHLLHGTSIINRLYELLKKEILKLGNVTIEPKKFYIAFKSISNICDIQIQKNKLKVFINMQKGTLSDPNDIAKDVSSVGHWGNGDYLIYLCDEEMIEYTIFLIKQSYEDKKE